MSKTEKWLTCTPKSFIGSARFFTRDSGLLCEGFKTLGYETQAIMLGPKREDDDERILRATMEEFCDAEFWRSFKAKGVVFYGWAMPCYTPICRAIKAAGLILVAHMDTGGLLSVRVEFRLCVPLLFRRYWDTSGFVIGSVKATLSLIRGMVPQWMDRPRLEHMELADLIGGVSPISCDRIKYFATYYERHDIASKVRLIGHPVSPAMRYKGGAKKMQICAVGRWTQNDLVKQPYMMLKVLKEALSNESEYQVIIIGEYDLAFENNLKDMMGELYTKIILLGRKTSEEIASVLNESRISLCTSMSESFHIASAEALCCGCSVVSYKSPYLPSFDYFVSENSGVLANDGSTASLAGALVDEMRMWNHGVRDPQLISDLWTHQLHAECVTKSILGFVESAKR
jgi:glycosyltransferase involved in cell wall biosynthesis